MNQGQRIAVIQRLSTANATSQRAIEKLTGIVAKGNALHGILHGDLDDLNVNLKVGGELMLLRLFLNNLRADLDAIEKAVVGSQQELGIIEQAA
ncbi:hypothetical protein BB934_45305 (plasmid) [Microvirga ossetica]|uniref:Uncharacterized protein n=1 Tax=Microvirga ossetica TaxID=1882682 RepID=A0A1B2EZL7_9HYPH|nr:hypothetical protein [Microvirga ossetica]ANY85439.1 hypothetical protein BB934_45305 [Microvirga ossetica]